MVVLGLQTRESRWRTTASLSCEWKPELALHDPRDKELTSLPSADSAAGQA